MAKQLLAEVMRELTATSDYRKLKSEMMRLAKTFSKQRYVMVHKPDEQTLEMFRNEGFEVSQTKVTEFIQFKISW